MTSTMPKPTAAAASVKEEKPAASAVAAAAAVAEESPLLKSVSAMRTLSFAISAFSRRFEELQKHLDSIQKSIEQRSQELGSGKAPPPQQQQQQQQQHVEEQQEEPAPNPNPNPNSSASPGRVQDPRSEVERLCENMSGRGLRKYVVGHLSDADELRHEVPEALKRASDPARLVLDCIGAFYLQGRKAYTKDSPMITSRQACILILEFFLASGCSKIDPSVKAEAEKAAICWRNRLVQEGGIAFAGDADAMGLLLFVAAFGIPSEFGRYDLYDLIRMSNLQKKADVLRRFPALVERIKDTTQEMVNNGMHIAAVVLACAFGLKEKFSPVSLLSSFLQEVNRIGTEMRREGQSSFVSLKEANEKQVDALKLAVKCVEDYKLNCAEVASWKIDQKIAKLEKEIERFEKRKNERNLKRKAEIELLAQVKTQEHRHQPTTIKAQALRPHHAAIPSQEQNLYEGYIPQAMFAGGFPGLGNSFSDPSIKSGAALSDGSGMGLLSGNVSGALAGLGSGHGILAGAYPSADSIRLTSTNDKVRSYGWHEERAVNNNSVMQQSLLGLPSSAGQNLMGMSAPMVKEFPVSSHQGSTSNLYQFADTVLQGESYYNSPHKGNAALVFYPPSHY